MREVRYRLRGQKLTDLAVIMVVEDDQQVQILMEEALNDGGFQTAKRRLVRKLSPC
jgi:hypothetical protein